jgi:hypothetical protein
MARSGAEGPGLAVEASLAGAGDFVVQMASMRLQGLQRLVVTVADIAPVKQAQREREEVLAFVSHDLRSPASAIVLLADLQLQGRAHTPQDELLREMRRLATRTLAMSEEFVRASHVQTQPLAPSPVRPLSLIDDALADLRAQASDRQVTLQTAPLAAGSEADATLPGADQACVAVDRALVTRAIGNLVSNALKHSPPGGTVWVQGGVLQGRLRVQVRDHGPRPQRGAIAAVGGRRPGRPRAGRPRRGPGPAVCAACGAPPRRHAQRQRTRQRRRAADAGPGRPAHLGAARGAALRDSLSHKPGIAPAPNQPRLDGARGLRCLTWWSRNTRSADGLWSPHERHCTLERDSPPPGPARLAPALRDGAAPDAGRA